MTNINSSTTLLDVMRQRDMDVAVLPTYSTDLPPRNVEEVSIDTTIQAFQEAGVSAGCPVRYPRDSDQPEVMAFRTIPEVIVLPVLYLLNDHLDPQLVLAIVRDLISAAIGRVFAKKESDVEVRMARHNESDGKDELFEYKGPLAGLSPSVKEFLRYLENGERSSD